MVATVASKVPFSEIGGLLEKIEKLSAKKAVSETKKSLVRDFIKSWREFHDKLHADDPNTTDSFYAAMRLLVPQLEKERAAYGIKEHTLAKHMIDVLGLAKEGADAQKLLNYKAPKHAKGNVGDFASVAYFVLKNRCPEKGSLTIEEVNEHLDSISINNAKKNKQGVLKSIMHLLKNMSALEQKWLIRMIMKELKCGISQQTVFALFHEDAEDLYNVTNSLEKVCLQLRDPNVRLHEIGISLFLPFRPMLGERAAPNKVEKLMDSKDFFIETKYDGERMQLHRDEGEYKYFSRGGNDYTGTYGNDMYHGNFTSYIDNCFKPGVKSCILDGEMMGYNPETKTLGSKGENFDIKSTKEMENYHPCYCVFDVLMLNGKVWSNKPLTERLEALVEIFNPVEGRIFLAERRKGRTNQDVADALNEAIDGREEGIMVKRPDSIYKPNTRKGGWFKIKPEYVGGLMDELDVCIIGGYFGVGHRAGMMSHFLCGVAEAAPDGEHPTVFQSFCKVGSGYSKKELFEFNRKLASHWKPFDKKNPPRCIVLASGFKEKPDAYIHPSNSYIVQVKAAEIIDSDRFKTGCTLRFPRVEKIRDDKHWYDSMTTADVEELKQKSGGKLASGFALADDDEGPSKKKRRIVQRNERPTVSSQFRGVDTTAIKKTSEVFQDLEFCIMNGTAEFSKAHLEQKVVEFGGQIVQNADEQSTLCVVADKIILKVRNYIKKDCYDVVKATWLARCIEAKRFIPWVPSDMHHTSPKTTRKFAFDYDAYGDSYYEDTSVQQLKRVFQKVEAEGAAKPVSQEEIAEFESVYFPDDSPYGLFRTCRFYMDNKLAVDDVDSVIPDCSLELTALDIRFHGGTVVDKLDKKVSHLVVHSSDLSRVQELRNLSKKRERNFHIVTEDWVKDCIESDTLKTERYYEPPAS
ncbi:DNA ligase 4-like [Lineus longissimus]|uniref:DNA ligase 4-like n=1 Tax=Lineus longissimus TaxID=88925 RepID=UPI002B4DD89F